MVDKKALFSTLFYNLESVPRCGTPGLIQAFSSNALCHMQPVPNQCVSGLSYYGDGRMVGIAHNGYFWDMLGDNDKGRRVARFVKNSIFWGVKQDTLCDAASAGQFCEINNALYPFATGQPISVGALGLAGDKLTEMVKMMNAVPQGGAAGGGGQTQLIVAEAQQKASEEAVEKVLAAKPDVVLWTNSDVNLELTRANAPLFEGADGGLGLEAQKGVDKRAAALLNYVRTGGCLIIAVCPWGWDQTGQSLAHRCLFNHVLRPAGLNYLQGYSDTGAVNGNFPVPALRDNFLNTKTFGEALTDVVGTLKSRSLIVASDLSTSMAVIDELPTETLRRALAEETSPASSRGGPLARRRDELSELLLGVKNLVETEGIKNLKFPLKVGQTDGTAAEVDFKTATALLALPWGNKAWKALSVDQCPVAPQLESSVVPGALMDGGSGSSCPRVSNFLVTLNPLLTRWQFTGLYVPAGEVAVVSLPPTLLQAYPGVQFSVRLGVHKDTLKTTKFEDKDYKLERLPSVTSEREWYPSETGNADFLAFNTDSGPELSNEIGVASPFGGLLYVEILKGGPPRNTAAVAASLPLTLHIDGGCLAPYLNVQKERGETPVPLSPSTDGYPFELSWEERVRQMAAVPFGEIEGRFLAFTLPTKALAAASQAEIEAALSFWDAALQHELALAGQELSAKERIVTDVQISAGYMHSGYPVMTHLDQAEPHNGRRLARVLDVERLRRGEDTWGLYHELGHNRQKGAWTFLGTSEVTVNIFSFYCTHMLNGLSPFQAPHYKENSRSPALKYLAKPRDQRSFKNDWMPNNGLMLSTYALLIEDLGWKAFADVFRRYESLNVDPSSDMGKTTEWVRQLSIVTGQDLRPFFDQWAWPYEDAKIAADLDPLPAYAKDCRQIIEAN